MNIESGINKIYTTQLDSCKELVGQTLELQMDSWRSFLQAILPHSDLSKNQQEILLFSEKQLAGWLTVEKDYIDVLFESLKRCATPFDSFPEFAQQEIFRFLDHWEIRTEKVLESHTDFYALIFPWDDGDTESEKFRRPSVAREKETESVKTSQAVKAA